MKMNKQDVKKFYKELIQIVDNENYCNVDKCSETCKLMNKMNMSTDDIQQVVNSYPNDWNIENYVKPILEDELKYEKMKVDLDLFCKEKIFKGKQNTLNDFRNLLKTKKDSEIIKIFRNL